MRQKDHSLEGTKENVLYKPFVIFWMIPLRVSEVGSWHCPQLAPHGANGAGKEGRAGLVLISWLQGGLGKETATDGIWATASKCIFLFSSDLQFFSILWKETTATHNAASFLLYRPQIIDKETKAIF